MPRINIPKLVGAVFVVAVLLFLLYPFFDNERGKGDGSVISVRLVARETDLVVEVEKGSSVYDVMTTASIVYGFVFEAKLYEGLGYFVEGIGSVRNKNGFYWTLYIDDRYATSGVSNIFVEEGDVIEWRYQNRPDYDQ